MGLLRIRTAVAGLALAFGGALAAQAPAPPATPPAVAPAAPATPAPPTEIRGRPIEAWVADLHSADPTVRDTAVKVFPGFGHEAVRKKALPALLTAFDDKDPGVRINAMIIVSDVGFAKAEDLQKAVDKLAAILRETAAGSVTRLHAVRTLARFGPEARRAIPAVCLLANDPAWETRQTAAIALGRLGIAIYKEQTVSDGLVTGKMAVPKYPPSVEAMDKLSFVLIRDASAAVRLEACQSLILIGPPYTPSLADYAAVAEKYITALAARITAERDPGVKIWLQLLSMMYNEQAFEPTLRVIVSQVGASDPYVRTQALAALSVLGARAKPGMDAITKAMFSDESQVALAAIATVMSMGDESKSAIADLERLHLSGKDEYVKQVALEALKVLKKGRYVPVGSPPPPPSGVPPAAKKP